MVKTSRRGRRDNDLWAILEWMISGLPVDGQRSAGNWAAICVPAAWTGSYLTRVLEVRIQSPPAESRTNFDVGRLRLDLIEFSEPGSRSGDQYNGDQVFCLRPVSAQRTMSGRPNGGCRRVSPVAVRPGEGPLTEPTADIRACRWELVKMAPHLPFAISAGIGSIGWIPDLR
jgi:hypothetical protein